MKILADNGWSVPQWPVEHSGPDRSGVQRFSFEEEMRPAYAPVADRIGTELVAPVLYTFTSEAQRQRYLPAIRIHETFWAQGFSEPIRPVLAASRAMRDGNQFVVSGQKTWSTEGHTVAR